MSPHFFRKFFAAIFRELQSTSQSVTHAHCFTTHHVPRLAVAPRFSTPSEFSSHKCLSEKGNGHSKWKSKRLTHKSLALAQAIDLRPLASEDQVQSQVSVREVSIYMSDISDAVFPSRISIFPANY
jgi:hypothetical protein